MLWYSSQGFHTQRTGAGRLQAKEGPAGAAVWAAPGHRDVARPWLRQVTAATRHTPRCFQPAIGAHLSDEILRFLVEDARQLKESSGAADDGSIIRGHQIPN